MKEIIGITNWNDIVSPLYDSSMCLLIVQDDRRRFTRDIQKLSIAEKAIACREAGVTVLICGAISNIAKTLLVENGISVVSWIRGPVADIIDSYKRHEDIKVLFAMPGCAPRMCGVRQKRFRGRCGN